MAFFHAGGSRSPIRAEGDLDSDGKTEEYLLSDGCMSVKEGNQVLWKSPDDWDVRSFALGDVDNDGEANLAVSLWKQGSFGTSLPFWHKGEDVSYKNHLFLFKLVNGNFKSVWCSSNLDYPIASLEICDVNGDNINELVVEEGSYRKVFGERYALDADALTRRTILQWDQWGFTRLEAPQ
jgi:hypothetical protein